MDFIAVVSTISSIRMRLGEIETARTQFERDHKDFLAGQPFIQEANSTRFNDNLEKALSKALSKGIDPHDTYEDLGRAFESIDSLHKDLMKSYNNNTAFSLINLMNTVSNMIMIHVITLQVMKDDISNQRAEYEEYVASLEK